MGFAKTHNKGSKFSINSKDFPFITLNDLELDKEYTVRGVYILSKRGKMRQDMPNIVMDDKIVNIPSHMLNDVKDILSNDEYIAQIEDKKLNFTVYEYTNDEGTFRSVSWVDVE